MELKERIQKELVVRENTIDYLKNVLTEYILSETFTKELKQINEEFYIRKTIDIKDIEKYSININKLEKEIIKFIESNGFVVKNISISIYVNGKFDNKISPHIIFSFTFREKRNFYCDYIYKLN